MKTLVLIDGHNFLFRSFSIPFKFYSSAKTPLHVVSTFLKLLRRSVLYLNSEEIYVAVIFDTQVPTDNHSLSSVYKANRKTDYSKDEDNPFIHLPYIKLMLDYLQVKYFEMPSFEADDIIASIATKFLELQQGKVFIVSSDTDFYQLIEPSITIVKLLAKDETVFIDSEYIKEHLQIKPSDYVYYKSLIGDSADNIKGVAGIGPVRAKRIINKQVPFNEEENLVVLSLNKKLITLNRKVPIVFTLDSLHLSENLFQTNKQIFQGCKF